MPVRGIVGRWNELSTDQSLEFGLEIAMAKKIDPSPDAIPAPAEENSTPPKIVDPSIATDDQPATPSGEGQDASKPEKKQLTWIQAARQGDDEAFKKALATDLQKIIDRKKQLDQYEVFFLYDDDSITSYHSDRLYSAASKLKGEDKNILLIVHSPGGRIEPAYLISKTLKRIAGKKFVVAVPRRAKSAATLLALGADEIHMGMISQLGPIDPQVSGLPVLALGNALNHIANIVGKVPRSSDMWAKYLIDQVPIRRLGHYERVSESAAQYAERLLHGKQLPGGKTAAQVAQHLVQHYKDHSFVIDTEEAIELLGDDLVKEQTAEYTLADEIYDLLEIVEMVLRVQKKVFWIVGSLADDDIGMRKKSDDE